MYDSIKQNFSDLNGIIAMLLAAVLAQVRVVSIQEASAENGIKHV